MYENPGGGGLLPTVDAHEHKRQ